MSGKTNKNKYWVPDLKGNSVFLPGILTKMSPPNIVFEVNGEEIQMTLPPGHNFEDLFGECVDEQFQGVDNITTLTLINEGAVLQTLKSRYEREEIYTHIQKIVIAMNPFKLCPIYGADIIQKYYSNGANLPAHNYSI